jgi:hypothetical protein
LSFNKAFPGYALLNECAMMLVFRAHGTVGQECAGNSESADLCGFATAQGSRCLDQRGSGSVNVIYEYDEPPLDSPWIALKSPGEIGFPAQAI